MGFEDVVKLPKLFEHYQEHQKNYGDNFFSFLNKHYGSEKDNHESKEHDEHHDLPFNHSHHVCIDMKVDIPSLVFDCAINENIAEHFFVYQAPCTNSRTYSILQPPKQSC